jgi:hypothetical protein
MKIYLLAICLLLSMLVHAQIKKGGVFIGGDVALYGTKTNSENPADYTSKNNLYNFYPSIGWTVKENVVVGGNLLLSFSNNTQQSGNYNTKGNRIGAGIFIRKYLPIGKSFYLFGNAALNAQSIYSKYTTPQTYYKKETGYAIDATLIPGISYQLNKSLFLEVALNNLITLGYERRNTEESNPAGGLYKGSSNSYYLYSSLGSGVPLQVGLRWIIPGK